MTEYKKSSEVLVFNDKGELLLQMRAANDDSFPSHWSFSAGGGVESGEDAKLSAEREVKEELGVDAKAEFVREEHLTYPSWTPNVMREEDLSLYKTHHNGPFNLDTKEIEKVEFFALDTIKKMIASGEKFHPSFVLLYNKGVYARI